MQDGIAKAEQSSNTRHSLVDHVIVDIEVIAEPSGHHHGGPDEGREVGGNPAILPRLRVGEFLALAEQGQECSKFLNHERTPSAAQIHIRCHAKQDRKSTRLNSSHHSISYAVFCLKKKKDT